MYKNKFNQISKALAILIILCLNINGYAAVVSDSDGSGFVTKSEFEALKVNFSNQVSQYNSAIDNKIDGAISAYLASIDLSRPVTEKIIYNEWENCSAINGSLANTYQVPDIDFFFTMMYYHKYGGKVNRVQNLDTGAETSENYGGSFQHLMRLYQKTDWNTKNAYRNLVSCTGDYNNVQDLIWDGRALKYCETINITRFVTTWTGSSTYIAWLPYYDRPDTNNFSLKIRNTSTFKPTGYVEKWQDISGSSWPVSYYWVYNSGNRAITWTDEKQHESFATGIELKADSSGKTKDYEHIISYKGDSLWRVSDTKFTKLFRQASDNTNKASNLYSLATKTNQAKGSSVAWFTAFGAYGDGTSTGVRKNVANFYGDLSVAHEITDDSVLSSVGMLENDYEAKDIYQDNVITTLEMGNVKMQKDRAKLNQGFQLLLAKESDIIKWEPEFSYTHVHNGATTYTDNTHEVDIYFSNGPFTDDITTSNLIKVKTNNSAEEKNYATTVGRKCSVEFQMPKNGIVYVKWVPHNAGEYLDSDWIVTLDLSKCNTYTYVSE